MSIEYRVCMRIQHAAPEVLICECRVLAVSPDLRVQAEPEVTLLCVEFADGSRAYRDSDHARLVAGRFFDAQWLEHLSWPDVQQLCREEYCSGNFTLAEALEDRRAA